MDISRRRELRQVFDEDPDAFDRTRPVCPPGFFDDLVSFGALGPGAQVAEIGSGTGQATVPMAERGLVITGVELGGGLAAVARRKLASFPGSRVLTTSFEAWEGERGGFDAVVVINSLHWIDPELRYAKPFELLRPGGVLAVGGCAWARPRDADPFWFEVQQDYLAVGYAGQPPPPPEKIGPWHFPPEAARYFDEGVTRHYPFTVVYSSDDYLAILATQSGTCALGQARKAEFLALVRRRLKASGWPDLTATFMGRLSIGRRHERG